MGKSIRTMLISCFLSVICAPLCASSIVVGDDFTEPIPADGSGQAVMSPVSLVVTEHLVISDIDVYLDITHSDVSDLRIKIEPPWGKGHFVTLKEEWIPNWISDDDWRVNMYHTVFDDDAEDALIDGVAPYTGGFLPMEGSFLADFNGYDAFGVWTLHIYDAHYYDVGTLDRWELQISHVPEPICGWFFLIGGLMCLRRRHLRGP